MNVDYQDVLDEAAHLFKTIDMLAEKRLEQHREAEALALTNLKLHIQKLLGVPPMIAAIPAVMTVVELKPDTKFQDKAIKTIADEVDAAIMNSTPAKPALRRGRK